MIRRYRKGIQMGRIILVLLCILLALHCIHGYEYARCRSIFPDEIMDMQANVTSCYAKIEEHLPFEERKEEKFLDLSEIPISQIFIAFNLKKALPLKHFNIFKTKMRLFTLQHYNS